MPNISFSGILGDKQSSNLDYKTVLQWKSDLGGYHKRTNGEGNEKCRDCYPLWLFSWWIGIHITLPDKFCDMLASILALVAATSNVPLEADTWKVWVDAVVDLEVLLFRPTSDIYTTGQSIRTPIAWHREFISFD